MTRYPGYSVIKDPTEKDLAEIYRRQTAGELSRILLADDAIYYRRTSARQKAVEVDPPTSRPPTDLSLEHDEAIEPSRERDPVDSRVPPISPAEASETYGAAASVESPDPFGRFTLAEFASDAATISTLIAKSGKPLDPRFLVRSSSASAPDYPGESVNPDPRASWSGRSRLRLYSTAIAAGAVCGIILHIWKPS